MNETDSPEIRYVLDNILHIENLEEIFAGYTIESKMCEEVKTKRYHETIKNLIKMCDTPEKIQNMVRAYINETATLLNVKKVNLLLSLLEYAINNNLLSAKIVCEAILTNRSLDISNEVFFCSAFELIYRNISLVDYKCVRDLTRIIIDIVYSIPLNANVSFLPQLDVLHKVLSHILDRNSSILPAYLAFDEIRKKSGKCIHWKFSELLSSFVEDFKPVAQMVSIIGRPKLYPIVGYSSTLNYSWQLNAATAKFQLKGQIPYCKELLEPQTGLLRYVLEQPYSREMIYFMISLTAKQKPKCAILDEVFVDLIISAMERTEIENDCEITDYGSSSLYFLWKVLACHLITFVIVNNMSFSEISTRLCDKLVTRNFKKSRDHLMWMLLQFISGTIQKNSFEEFLPFFKIHDLLYPEIEPLPVPDLTKLNSIHQLACCCIWIHLNKKADLFSNKLLRPLPDCLKLHYEFLQQTLVSEDLSSNLFNDLKVPFICNAYSTVNEHFHRGLTPLLEVTKCNNRGNSSNNNTGLAMTPLPMYLLDSLTLHTKMSLLHAFYSRFDALAKANEDAIISPAMIETYSRLLIYVELETLGIKGFLLQILPHAVRTAAYGNLITLIEMFTYRIRHILPNYRVKFLNDLHYLSTQPQSDQIQVYVCMESTALRLIMGFTSQEVLVITQLSRQHSVDSRIKISNESEELNKVLILTLARSIHVSGCETLVEWCTELLTNVMQSTPLSWSYCTLECFPAPITDYYQKYSIVKENNSQLEQSVEEEYRKWITMSNESDIIEHFSTKGTSTLFLCLLWKMLLENDRINPLAYKILDRIGAKALSAHVRILADYLVHKFSKLRGENLNRHLEKLNDLIWKSYIIPLDRLLLCLTLRAYEGSEAQVSLFIIQMLLLTCAEFQNRVNDFVQEITPEYWKQSSWHEKHMAFQRKYPEKFYVEGLAELSGQSMQHTYLPTYFSNICLRFLPVMDLIIHRYLELPPNNQSRVDSLLEKYGPLYKFHDRPLTFLYETLHYYEVKLRDRQILRRKLVATIIGAFKDKPSNWALTDAYLAYIKRSAEDWMWVPDLDYYIKVIGRLVDTINGKSPFPHFDWRFNEFANVGAHALHVTCIELMALSPTPECVADALIDIVLVGHKSIPRSSIECWINAIGIVLTALPEAFWHRLEYRTVKMMEDPLFTTHPHPEPLRLMNFTESHKRMTEMQPSYLIALSHAFFNHASIGQITIIPQFLRDVVRPKIRTEEQLLFIMHIYGPFFHRLGLERTRKAMEMTVELYYLLEVVDKSCENLVYMDTICDLLYHMKYQITGDQVKNDIEGKIRNLRPELQKRLRFMVPLNIEATT